MPESRVVAWERLILTSFVVTLLVYGARSAHLLSGVETWWLDKMANADRASFAAPITVIAITDAVFHDPASFDGISPLHPAVLRRILERTLQHHPRGLVLDVQIHPPRHESPQRSQERLALYDFIEQAAEATPIVVARDLAAERMERRGGDSTWSAWDRMAASRSIAWADPTILRQGGYVRSVPRQYEDAAPLATILGAAVSAFGLEDHRSAPWWIHRHADTPTLPWRIRFSGLFLEEPEGPTTHHLAASALLETMPVAGQRSLLTDRIILVGGTYYAGRDLQPTVVGDMPGVYVWAEAIASWIRHDALREPLEPISFALEFLVGVVAGLLLIRFGPALGLLGALLIVAPLTVLFSLLTFGDRVLFVNFLPSFFGVYLHYQIELHAEIRHLKKQLTRPQTSAEPTLAPRDSTGGGSEPGGFNEEPHGSRSIR